MIRFMLRLVGALLVEEICERIRPVQWELVPLGKPSIWLPYYGPAVTGISGPTLFSNPLLEGDYMVGFSGTTPAGVDVSTPLIPRGTFKCKPASASGILPFSPIYEELPADFAPGYRVTRQGATMHFTPTDPYWKDG